MTEATGSSDQQLDEDALPDPLDRLMALASSGGAETLPGALAILREVSIVTVPETTVEVLLASVGGRSLAVVQKAESLDLCLEDSAGARTSVSFLNDVGTARSRPGRRFDALVFQTAESAATRVAFDSKEASAQAILDSTSRDVVDRALAAGEDGQVARHLERALSDKDSRLAVALRQAVARHAASLENSRGPSRIGLCASLVERAGLPESTALLAPPASLAAPRRLPRDSAEDNRVEASVRAALEASRRLVAPDLASGLHAAWPNTDDSETESTARGLGLPAALATLSRAFQQPLKPDALAIGVIRSSGRLTTLAKTTLLSDLEHLRTTAHRGPVLLPRDAETLCRPEDRKNLDLHFGETLAELIQPAFGETPELTERSQSLRRLEEAEALYHDYRRRSEAADIAQELLADPSLASEHAFRARVLLAPCLVSKGLAAQALKLGQELLQGALELLGSGSITLEHATIPALACADALVDRFEYAQALAMLEQARELVRHERGSPALASKVDALHGYTLYHADRHDEAELLVRRAIPAARRLDRPKFLCWLALIETERGDLAAGDEAIAAGLAASEAITDSHARASQMTFLLHARGRLELARGRPEEAEAAVREALDHHRHPGYPRTSLLSLYGESLLRQDQRLPFGLEMLESEAPALAGEPVPLFRLVRSLPVLRAIRARIELGHLDHARKLCALATEAISSYEPARDHFRAELASLKGSMREAWCAATRLLSRLKY